MENIKATRMELLKLKSQFKTAQRGYKLLKEKRDGLMKKFMEIIRQVKNQRTSLEAELANGFKAFAFTTAFLHQKELEEIFLAPSASVEATVVQENIMSVWIPKFQHQIQGDFRSYSNFSAPLALFKVLKKFWGTLESMLELAAKEHSARLLSFEIEKTRRRVNALEYVIIPEVKKKIRYISSKLDEQERSEKVIRLKIKSLIAK
ncbi:V-type ATP synthase subunit D [bacterium (Candidatus Gribaldobacteria) CG08_land_8_20_14_0_20_39_15]|uniref:V-type ATP synthase subunit D n=1 Tax=bacterium (Candidatus Gribaldobacteria) CG08_land_8_20_14_0_20_39_15 TaxID=2014273 RepID=A0A2M6XV01_9BACT|nr:MAG: V-type ATP synthase subunit D [bacterium (Candidatus Gribaldobacteria) CG08_land_8_20_14_0_20_39_15]